MIVLRLTVLCITILTACSMAGAGSYAVTDIGTLGGDWSGALAINNACQVVGISHVSGKVSHAFVWQNGARTDICTSSAYNGSYPWDINDAGLIVGGGWSGGTYFVWESGVMYNTDATSLKSVNNSGQVAGGVHLGLWQNGMIVDEVYVNGDAWGLNNVGDVVGYMPILDYRLAWVQRNGVSQYINTFGGTMSFAYAINDAGQAVGDSGRADGTYHAFLWQSGEMQDLGTLGGPNSSANAISSTGRIVGESDGPDGLSRAFIWESGVMTDLNQRIDPGSGWVLGGAYDINDYGQIVGWGYRDGYYRAFMLTPVYTTAIKSAPEGAQVEFGDMVVTAVFGLSAYVEADDRSFGIRVDYRYSSDYEPGSIVNVSGTISTDANGERFIDGALSGYGGPNGLLPVGLSNRAIGGGDWQYNPGAKAGQQGIKGASGLNNIGLLIKTWGTVTRIGDGWLYIDDGSDLRDGTQTAGQDNIGVKVMADTTDLMPGDKLRVVGTSSCFKNGEDLCRLIKATSVTKL